MHLYSVYRIIRKENVCTTPVVEIHVFEFSSCYITCYIYTNIFLSVHVFAWAKLQRLI